MTLTTEDLQRYNRHIILPEIGIEGQQKLKNAKVLLIGTGGLGSPLALYLAASGIGTIGLVDFDTVDISNLQRQVIHETNDVGKPKLESASRRLLAINPHLKLNLYNERLTRLNALDVIEQYDVVADGTDNFATRYLINDACVLLNKPNVFGSIRQFEGQLSVYWAEKGPCYRCLFPDPPMPGTVPSCSEAGVMGVLPGVVGTLQATEVIKLILEKGTPLIGKLLNYDALEMSFTKLSIAKDPSCAICGTQATIKELIDYDIFCGLETTTILKQDHLSPQELKALMATKKELFLLDVRETYEVAQAKIENSINIPRITSYNVCYTKLLRYSI